MGNKLKTIEDKISEGCELNKDADDKKDSFLNYVYNKVYKSLKSNIRESYKEYTDFKDDDNDILD